MRWARDVNTSVTFRDRIICRNMSAIFIRMWNASSFWTMLSKHIMEINFHCNQRLVWYFIRIDVFRRCNLKPMNLKHETCSRAAVFMPVKFVPRVITIHYRGPKWSRPDLLSDNIFNWIKSKTLFRRFTAFSNCIKRKGLFRRHQYFRLLLPHILNIQK